MWWASQICGITQEHPFDPVMTAAGQLYDRKAIRKWLDQKCTDPLTGMKLPLTKDLLPVVWSKFKNEEEFRQWKKKIQENSAIWGKDLIQEDQHPLLVAFQSLYPPLIVQSLMGYEEIVFMGHST